MRKCYCIPFLGKRGWFACLLIISLFLLPIAARGESSQDIEATSGTCGTNLIWEFADGTLTISGTGEMTNYTYTGTDPYILPPWNSLRPGITSIIVNSGATSIGDYAFAYCGNMTYAELPDTIITIGDSSFESCGKLQNITLGNRVECLGESAFAFCRALESCLFPPGLTSIGHHCFQSSGLKEIILPSTVTDFGNEVFRDCLSLTEFSFPGEITTIPKYFMFGCSHLEKITIGEGTQEIQTAAFSYCSSLTTVTIPTSLTSVGRSAFNECRSISEVIYAGTKTQAWEISIGETNNYFVYAIWHCIDGDIPKTKGSCGANLVWEYADGTLIIHGTGAMNNWVSFTLPRESYLNVPWEAYKADITSIIIYSGVTSIGNFAFAHCENLTYIDLPNTITTIGDGAFLRCIKLSNVTLGNQVQSLGEIAFSACLALESFSFPPSLTSIGPWCFDSSGLRSITIPNTVTDIGDHAFMWCSSLKKYLFLMDCMPFQMA